MPMAATPPSNSKSSGDDRASAENPVPLTLEDRLNQFWQKNRMIVLGLCALVLVAILGKGLWEHMQQQQEHDIESAYANASTPDQLRAFVAAHPNHELAGIAELRIADEAYTAGKYSDAATAYAKVRDTIKSGPLATRAQLGHALSTVQGGNATDGANELKQIFNDAAQFKAARAEAGYELAALAADAGNVSDVQKYADQVAQIDAASPWTQRAMMLRASLPAAPAAAAPAAAAKDAGSPGVQVKIPGK